MDGTSSGEGKVSQTQTDTTLFFPNAESRFFSSHESRRKREEEGN